MAWEYTASVAWLEERNKFVTATNFGDLRATFLKRGKGAKEEHAFFLACAKLWASKHKCVAEPTFTSQAMMRGNELEPFAIDDYRNATGNDMYHWDSIIVTKGCVGASPDGLDVEMPMTTDVSVKSEAVPAKHAVEVKCLGDEYHMAMVFEEDKKKVDIKYILQMAAMLYVIDSLEDITIVFYNPSLDKFKMKTFTYTREEMADEIKLIEDMANAYMEEAAKIDAALDTTPGPTRWTEATIKLKLMELRFHEEVNDGERDCSVQEVD